MKIDPPPPPIQPPEKATLKEPSLIRVKHNYFKNSFFPSTIIELNELNFNIRYSESPVLFKKRRLAFIRPFTNVVQKQSPGGVL